MSLQFVPVPLATLCLALRAVEAETGVFQGNLLAVQRRSARFVVARRRLWQLLRDATRVLLEGVPKGLDVDAVEQSLQSAEGVEAVHHLHVWSIGSETPALSAHVVLAGELTLHQAQARGDELKHRLADQFGIEHATLELECHQCDDDEHDIATRSRTATLGQT